MIISGGINMMPARVEEVLLAHAAVAECAVVGVPDPEWGETVQAFIVCREPSLDAAALERHVRGSDLSSYQRPRRYHFVAELPRTSASKQGAPTRPARKCAWCRWHIMIVGSGPIDGEKMSQSVPILLVERREQIAIVTLNRPDKRNALSEALWAELKKTLKTLTATCVA